MIDRDIFGARPLQLALGGLVVALALTTWTVMRAVQLTPVPDAAPAPLASLDAYANNTAPAAVDVAGVVSQDVFSPNRTAPARRYRVGGYGSEPVKVEPPRPVVLGTFTATAAAHTFAICKVADGPSTVVHVGDIIAGYTVKTIERGVVTFMTSNGERLAINAAK